MIAKINYRRDEIKLFTLKRFAMLRCIVLIRVYWLRFGPNKVEDKIRKRMKYSFMLFGGLQMIQVNSKKGKIYEQSLKTLKEFFLEYYWNFKIK